MQSFPKFLRSEVTPRAQDSPFPPFKIEHRYKGVYERAGFDVNKGRDGGMLSPKDNKSVGSFPKPVVKSSTRSASSTPDLKYPRRLPVESGRSSSERLAQGVPHGQQQQQRFASDNIPRADRADISRSVDSLSTKHSSRNESSKDFTRSADSLANSELTRTSAGIPPRIIPSAFSNETGSRYNTEPADIPPRLNPYERIPSTTVTAPDTYQNIINTANPYVSYAPSNNTSPSDSTTSESDSRNKVDSSQRTSPSSYDYSKRHLRQSGQSTQPQFTPQYPLSNQHMEPAHSIQNEDYLYQNPVHSPERYGDAPPPTDEFNFSPQTTQAKNFKNLQLNLNDNIDYDSDLTSTRFDSQGYKSANHTKDSSVDKSDRISDELNEFKKDMHHHKQESMSSSKSWATAAPASVVQAIATPYTGRISPAMSQKPFPVPGSDYQQFLTSEPIQARHSQISMVSSIISKDSIYEDEDDSEAEKELERQLQALKTGAIVETPKLSHEQTLPVITIGDQPYPMSSDVLPMIDGESSLHTNLPYPIPAISVNNVQPSPIPIISVSEPYTSPVKTIREALAHESPDRTLHEALPQTSPTRNAHNPYTSPTRNAHNPYTSPTKSIQSKLPYPINTAELEDMVEPLSLGHKHDEKLAFYPVNDPFLEREEEATDDVQDIQNVQDVPGRMLNEEVSYQLAEDNFHTINPPKDDFEMSKNVSFNDHINSQTPRAVNFNDELSPHSLQSYQELEEEFVRPLSPKNHAVEQELDDINFKMNALGESNSPIKPLRTLRVENAFGSQLEAENPQQSELGYAHNESYNPYHQQPAHHQEREITQENIPLDHTGKYAPGQGPCRLCLEEILPNGKGSQKAIFSKTGELSGQWHRSCFSCNHEGCNVHFNKNVQCYAYDDLPYCKHHYHELNDTLCELCSLGIEGECIENELNQKWHLHCLKCFKCNNPIKQDYYLFNGLIVCETDAMSIMEGRTSLKGSTDKLEKRRTRLMFVD